MMNLYQFPELYNVLRAPDAPTLRFVKSLIKHHLDGPLDSVMDPACGPGTWLVPFAEDGVRVAGNDIASEMVEAAKADLAGYPSEFVEGDMRDLHFQTGPFDVAFELSGGSPHLHEDEDFTNFLRSLAENVRAGGLVLLTLFFEDAVASNMELPAICWQHGPVRLSCGGSATVTYAVVDRDPVRGLEWMRRSVHTQNALPLPAMVEDLYPLRVWPVADFFAMLDRIPTLDYITAFPSHGKALLVDVQNEPEGEALVLLRRI